MIATKYPANWRKVSRRLRSLAAGRCEWCGATSTSLSVHHIGTPYADGRPGNSRDKHDLRRENLAVLCFACHDRVDHLRQMRQRFKARKAKRCARRERHQALGVGTGLLVLS